MIAILDYSAGNIQSVMNALDRLSTPYKLTNDPTQIENSDKLIIPGVGEAGTAMSDLNKNGLVEIIRNYKRPVLGICLGMQLLCRSTEESDTACIGVFDSTVKRFSGGLNVPHTGWNSLSKARGPLFKATDENSDYYFVHSYFASLGPHTSSICHYGYEFSASLEKDNFFGVQFHPEKSSKPGALLLKRFIDL